MVEGPTDCMAVSWPVNQTCRLSRERRLAKGMRRLASCGVHQATIAIRGAGTNEMYGRHDGSSG